MHLAGTLGENLENTWCPSNTATVKATSAREYVKLTMERVVSKLYSSGIRKTENA